MGMGEDDSGIGVANRELGRRQRKEAKFRERSKESRGERGEVGDEGASKGKNRGWTKRGSISLGRGTAQRGIDRLIMRARGRQMGQTAPRAVIRAFLAFCSLCTSGTASLAAFSFLTLVPKDVARYNNIPHYAMALCLAVLISVFGAFFTHQTLHTHTYTHPHPHPHPHTSLGIPILPLRWPQWQAPIASSPSVSRFAIGPHFKQPKSARQIFGEIWKRKGKKRKSSTSSIPATAAIK